MDHQGPESIVHPLSLKLANWHCEFASVVQLPVLTNPRGPTSMTGGAGFDDLGEHRARELPQQLAKHGSVGMRHISKGG